MIVTYFEKVSLKQLKNFMENVDSNVNPNVDSNVDSIFKSHELNGLFNSFIKYRYYT